MATSGSRSPVEFVRALTRVDATALVAGSMIGSGVYIVSADIARQVGSPGMLMLVWLIAGVTTVIGALTYSELAALFPRASRRHTGTAAVAKAANIRSCACHDGSSTNDTSPTRSAASPSQNRKTPGAINSSAIRTKPKISQFQVPSVENISVMV